MSTDAVPLTTALRAPTTLLFSAVRDYCSAHPYEGEPVEDRASDPAVNHGPNGKPYLARVDAPDVMFVSAQLLDMADPAMLAFHDGVLTFRFEPEPLHYRVLYPTPRLWAFVCRLLDENEPTTSS